LAVAAAGLEDSGINGEGSSGGTSVGVAGGADWHDAVVTVRASPSIMAGIILANAFMIIGHSLITGVHPIMMAITFHI